MWSTSIEVAVAVAPAATYGRLLHGADAHAGSDLLQRLDTILLVIGVAVSTMAAQRVTVGLVTTIALSWSFVLGVQAAIGALIRHGRTVAMDADGQLYGDPELVRIAETVHTAGRTDVPSGGRRASLALAWFGVLGLLVFSKEVS